MSTSGSGSESQQKTWCLWICNGIAIVLLVLWLAFGFSYKPPTLFISSTPKQPISITDIAPIADSGNSLSEPYVGNVDEIGIGDNEKFSSPFTTTIATIANTQTIAFIGNADIDPNLYASVPRITIASLDNLDGKVGTASVGRYIMLLNFGKSISISRWKIFIDDQFFYQIPDFTIEKGRAMRIHIGSGKNTKEDLFANFENLPTSVRNIKRVTLRDECNAIIDELEILENTSQD